MSLTAAQRRALLESDADTGRLTAREATCAALAKQGLAVRYGRTGGFYLTPEGLRVRTAMARVEPPYPAKLPPTQEPPAAGFVADDGRGPRAAGPRRGAEVAAAWSGLLEIRRVLQDGDIGKPAPWERERYVHAVALALEAAGRPASARDEAGLPTATGYAVAPSAQDGVAEVSWHSPGDGPDASAQALEECGTVLEEYGWQSTLHRDRGGRRAFLLVSPRRA